MRSERILVVEDDEAVREVSVEIFRDQGYEVAEAKNGKEAIEQLSSGQSFDLLFTDVVLPGGMRGEEIGSEAKRLQPHIKVIYTSGYSQDALISKGQLDQEVTLVKKPYRRSELLEAVHALLSDGND